MIIQVYRNLHRKCYSLRDKRTRLVNAHEAALVLKEATFKVSEAGRQRVLREKRKNVHAVVEGELLFAYTPGSAPHSDITRENCAAWGLVPIAYNPYKGPFFYRADTGEAVAGAQRVYLNPNGCFAVLAGLVMA